MQRRTLLILLLAVCLLVPPAADAQRPIKVGMPMPLSGPPALFGEPASKGAMMYVEEINAKGGVSAARSSWSSVIPRPTPTRRCGSPAR
jgi:hypothetical protein